jgi:hypothetical protein
MRIEIERNEGGRLVVEDAERLALDFFENDISSARDDSYDERARTTDPSEPFRHEDVGPIKSGMRLGRLKKPTWDWLVGESPQGFLAEIDASWDLVETPAEDWPRVLEAMTHALYDFMGAGRGAPVATKFLHFKRRLLFPILDSAVLAMTGLRIPGPTTSKNEATVERSRRNRAAVAAAACSRMRDHALHNAEALGEIRTMLAARRKDRSLARILDALLWSAHPASEPSHRGVLRWSQLEA